MTDMRLRLELKWWRVTMVADTARSGERALSAAYVHSDASRPAFSSGSPMISESMPATCTSEWQVAMMRCARGRAASEPVTTSSSSRWSLVRVPVLSKQHTSTLPAKGMRKGSVQNTFLRASATSDAFTAMDSSMGSSGGMTDVMIITQLRMSLKRSRSGSARPLDSTCQAAATAKMSRKRMKMPASMELALTRSVENRMVRMRRPWEVSNPVRSTKARQPPSGVRMRPALSPVCCRILVPPNRMWFLSSFMLRVALGSSSAAGTFH
mmetsp:Transcript_37477/g.94597  ORF Transcript_37477/g.94597 Transcript_37477/m.94597 type:complete len:267 (-) Transcript_37477:946-1746(-)